MRICSPLVIGLVIVVRSLMQPRSRIVLLAAIASTVVNGSAQTDEIQVYDAEIAAPGIFNLMIHNNYARGPNKACVSRWDRSGRIT